MTSKTLVDTPSVASTATHKPVAGWSNDELIPFGKYILLNKLSMGATSAVYRAKVRGEAGFERIVTIKRILPQMAGDPEFVETFVHEAKICARLTHGNIAPIYELGKVGESLYMALQWIAGKDLGAITRRLAKNGALMPPLAAAWIASRLCDALDYAHTMKDADGQRLGILHQDISPANVVLSYEGEVKLIDFGIARASGRAQQTNVEALKQKLGYMSPELVLGTALDARSDVFGVGVCLYEMVTGQRLFAGPDDIATLKLVSNAAVAAPSTLRAGVPEELETIIMRALGRDPDARWPSAGEMAHALHACVAHEDPTYGTRNIAELMRTWFEADMLAEQRQLHELTVASQNPQLMEQRRKFFASPMGAAAVAKAEAARKLSSTRPPAPMPLPAGVARRAQAPKAQPPAATQHESPEDDELTHYRSEQNGAISSKSVSGERLTAQPAVLPIADEFDDATRADASSEDEPTMYRGASTATTPEALDEELTTYRSDAKPVDLQRVRATVPAPSAAIGGEDEHTHWFTPEQLAEAELTAVSESAALDQPPEEEATEIYFAAEHGALLNSLAPVVPAEQVPEAPLAPLPSIAKRTQNFAALGGSSVSGKHLSPSRAPATGRFHASKLLDSPPAREPSVPVATSAVRQSLPLSRQPTLELQASSVFPRSAHGPWYKLAPWLAIAVLLITSVYAIARTSLGITLGLRSAPFGVIEVSTAPAVSATIKLDGMYRGRAPLRLDAVPAGNRVLSVEADGYESVSVLIAIEGGSVISESVSLTRLLRP